MATKWLLYDITNIGILPRNHGERFDYRYIKRNFEILDNFAEAKARMKSVIQKYTDTEYGLFDDDGKLIDLDELCDMFTKFKQGVDELGSYFNEPDENSEAFISNLPIILKDFFSGKEDLDPVFANFVDVNLPFLLNASCEINYEEAESTLQLGNIDESFEDNKYISKINAPYLIPGSQEEVKLPISISINSFNMNNPEINYFCRITGKYKIFEDAAPFFNVELVRIEC